MAASQNNLWGQHDLNSVCFGLGVDMERSVKELQQQHMAKEYNDISLSQTPYYPDTYRLMSDHLLLPGEGDQVVPSSNRRSIFGGHHKEPKPLPPLPDPEELMSDEAADSEVEFFTSDRRRLLPKSCPKATCRDSGQVNRAYQENSLRGSAARIGSVCFSWPSREDKVLSKGGQFTVNSWSLAIQGDSSQNVASADSDHYSNLSPPLHVSNTTCHMDKPQVPPRIPIPPKPSFLSKTVGEDDKPPKIPPRVPLVPPCPPRTPSPKTLPIYINGVMPATQSFAANPKYVSKSLPRQSDRATPTTNFSPCIVPILKDGRQTSATHYILLPPGRPAHTDRRERPLSEPNRIGHTWQRR